MQSLIDPLVTELDPETQAVIDEVCTALEWFDADVPGSTEMARAFAFGRKWNIARKAPDPECRRKIHEAMDALVRSDDELVMTVQGQIFTRDQISQYHGRCSYVVDSQTGESRMMLEWPTGTYASGQPSFEKPEERTT